MPGSCHGPSDGYGDTLRYLRAARVAITCRQRFFPMCSGAEFTSNPIVEWTETMQVTRHCIAPDKPMRDTTIATVSTV